MVIKKDMVTTTEEKVKDAVASAKKENISEIKADNARRKAIKDVKLAVSKYIEELREKVGSLAEIAKKMDDIESQIQKNTADMNSSFERSLRQWHSKEVEPSLYHLCLLTQVHHVSYDYILGLDKKIDTNQLSYGYTLDFFFYLFRTQKLEILRSQDPNIIPSVTTVASKGYFNMTRYLIVKDRTLYNIIEELNYQKQTDLQEKNKDKVDSRYKRMLQQYISKYENIPLVSEACSGDTDRPKPLLPDNGQNKPSQEIYHGLPEDLADRLKSLPKKYGKTQGQFAKDAGIAPSTFSDWTNERNPPSSSYLYLMAKTYGFSIDSLLHTGTPDKNLEKHQYKYTYGNTLRFIDQLETAGVVYAAANLKYVPHPADSTPHHTKSSDGKNPKNMNYSCNGEPGYLPGIFFIRDDFLIRLITEIEAEMSRPFDAPQSLDTAQISYEASQQNVKEFIARYDNENLLCYQKNIRKALGNRSEKWRKYCYGHNEPLTSILDISFDLDEMLKELRAVEIEASEALYSINTIKQET